MTQPDTAKIQEHAGRPNDLFRQRAVGRSARMEGMVVLKQPGPVRTLIFTSVAILLAVVAFLVTASYARRQTASGFVMPSSGLLQISSDTAGQLLDIHVKEGQVVAKGDLLFQVRQEHKLGDGKDGGEELNHSLQTSISEIDQHIGAQQQLDVLTVDRLRSQRDTAENHQQSLTKRLDYAEKKLQILQRQLARYEPIMSAGYVSQDQVDQLQASILQAKSDHDSLQLDLDEAVSNLHDLTMQIDQKQLEQKGQLSELLRQNEDAKRQLLQHSLESSTSMVSSVAGTISAIKAFPGQTVSAQTTIMTVVPSHAKFVVELYVPGSAVASIHPGEQVYLKFQSFPYQKYGMRTGEVLDVSVVTFVKSELPFRIAVDDVPLYRVRVELPPGSRASALGAQLRPGMLVEADVILERTPLWRWLAKPLMSTTGSSITW